MLIIDEKIISKLLLLAKISNCETIEVSINFFSVDPVFITIAGI